MISLVALMVLGVTSSCGEVQLIFHEADVVSDVLLSMLGTSESIIKHIRLVNYCDYTKVRMCTIRAIFTENRVLIEDLSNRVTRYAIYPYH